MPENESIIISLVIKPHKLYTEFVISRTPTRLWDAIPLREIFLTADFSGARHYYKRFSCPWRGHRYEVTFYHTTGLDEPPRRHLEKSKDHQTFTPGTTYQESRGSN